MNIPTNHFLKVCKYTQFRVFTLSFFFVFFFSGLFLHGQNSWKRYTLGNHLVSVSFPDAPREDKKDLYTQLGTLPSVSLTYAPTPEDKNFLYSAQWVQYPEFTFPEDSVDLIALSLHETIVALSDNLKCKIIYENEAPEGRHVRIFRLEDAKSRQAVKGKVIIYKNCLITATVFSTIEKSLNDNIDTFLHSVAWE